MAFALVPELPAAVEPPAIVAPRPREVSAGRVAGTVGTGTARVLVLVNGKKKGEEAVRGTRFELRVELPPRDSTVRVVALGPSGDGAARSVRRVFGLPPTATGTAGQAPYEDAALARRVRALVERFPGIAGVYVQNLRTGAGAAWNARARFPAASTLKVGIAIEVLRALDSRPAPGSSLDRLLELMLVHSDNAAANELLTWLGGSETAGAAEVSAMLERIGLGDSEMYGGYEPAAARGPPIPLRVESEPTFSGKHTTAFDLAQLHRFLSLAAEGRGPLLDRLGGSFTASDARFLLYVLAHTADGGKLDRFVGPNVVVLHKAGWVSEARHDSGLVYSRSGVLVASVMTWAENGAGPPSDVLAGRIVRAALARFRTERRRPELTQALSFRL